MKVGIRDIDPELWKLAKIEALKVDKTISQWLNEAIREKLNKTKERG